MSTNLCHEHEDIAVAAAVMTSNPNLLVIPWWSQSA